MLAVFLLVAADEGRFQDFAVGARAAALGGAYTALADDASGVFYNPAGLVDVRTPRINVSTSLYGLELDGVQETENNVFRKGVSPTDLIFVPSSTGYVQGSGDVLPSGAWSDAIAFGTLVPDYTSRFEGETPTKPDGRSTRSSLEDRRLIAGGAWAHRLGPWLRLGISAQYSLRTIDAEEALDEGDLGGGAYLSTSTHVRESNHSLRAVGGAKVWLGPRTTLGLMVATPATSLYRDVTFEHVVSSSDGYSAVRANPSGFEMQWDMPAEARLGFAFSEPGSYTLAVDVSGHLGTEYDVIRASDIGAGFDASKVPIPLHVERGPVANAAVGAEALISDDLSIAGGLFTNLTGAPALKHAPGSTDLSDDSSRLSSINMYGASLSLGFHSEFSVTRIGFTGSMGYGDIVEPSQPTRLLLDDGPPLEVKHTLQTFVYLFVATTFRFGTESSGRDYTL